MSAMNPRRRVFDHRAWDTVLHRLYDEALDCDEPLLAYLVGVALQEARLVAERRARHEPPGDAPPE